MDHELSLIVANPNGQRFVMSRRSYSDDIQFDRITQLDHMKHDARGWDRHGYRVVILDGGTELSAWL